MEFIKQHPLTSYNCPPEMSIPGEYKEEYASILTNPALRFLSKLHEEFNGKRKELLQRRGKTQTLLDSGIFPDFLESTLDIRISDWTVSPIPPDLLDRRVELNGPTDRKTITKAFYSGANVFVADFEDSNTPCWDNVMKGQVNLRDTVNEVLSPERAPVSKNEKVKHATLMVRTRAWHQKELNIWYKGEPMSASLVDFGLYFFHNVKKLENKGTGPYFYLPKMENHLEARLWNEVFVYAQEYMSFAQKTIKAAVSIDTIMSAFEMNEILYELKEHVVGMSCDLWDYSFSFIKKFRNAPNMIFPDRDQLNVEVPFLKAINQLLIQTCHRRGVHAIAGRSTLSPAYDKLKDNDKLLEKVRLEKQQKAKEGYDGTTLFHINLVNISKEVFDTHLATKNQITNKRKDIAVSAVDLMKIPGGKITEAGLRSNIQIGIIFLESWLRGKGVVSIHNQIENVATAELCRSQIWHWIHCRARLEDGRMVTTDCYKTFLLEEIDKIELEIGERAFLQGKYTEAIHLFDQLIQSEEMVEFMTLHANELVI